MKFFCLYHHMPLKAKKVKDCQARGCRHLVLVSPALKRIA
jgi:hypothetical protein